MYCIFIHIIPLIYPMFPLFTCLRVFICVSVHFAPSPVFCRHHIHVITKISIMAYCLFNNCFFSQTVMLAQNRKMREKKHLFFLEGSRYILDAVNVGIKVVSLFFTKGEQLENFPLDEMVADGTQLYKVKMGHMQLWSTLVAASGMMGECFFLVIAGIMNIIPSILCG